MPLAEAGWAAAAGATRLAIKYGARWLAKTAARRGVKSAAGSAARARLRAAAQSRSYWTGVERGLNRAAGVGLGSVAAGGLGSAYLYSRYRRGPPSDMVNYAVGNKRRAMYAPGYSRPVRRRFAGGGGATTPAIVRTSARRGRKPSVAKKVRQIVKASERNAIFNFRGMNTLGSVSGLNKGFFTLAYQDNAEFTDWQSMPVHCYNLTGIPQGGTLTNQNFSFGSYDVGVQVPWVLAVKKSAGGDDNASWQPGQPGQTNDTVGGTVSRTWNLEHLTDATDPSSVGAFGRHVYNDWISAKFMIYGKKKQDTKLHIRLVKFTRDEFCPEFDEVEASAVITKDARLRFVDAAKSLLKPLINNPIASRISAGRSKMFTVLYDKYISIPPKSDDDSNDDPAIVQHNLFYRMNKVMDHSDPRRGAAEPADDGEDVALLADERYVPPSAVGFRAQPKRLRDNVYLMVSSWDPFAWGAAAPTTDYSNTYDLNLRRKVTLELV